MIAEQEADCPPSFPLHSQVHLLSTSFTGETKLPEEQRLVVGALQEDLLPESPHSPEEGMRAGGTIGILSEIQLPLVSS